MSVSSLPGQLGLDRCVVVSVEAELVRAVTRDGTIRETQGYEPVAHSFRSGTVHGSGPAFSPKEDVDPSPNLRIRRVPPMRTKRAETE